MSESLKKRKGKKKRHLSSSRLKDLLNKISKSVSRLNYGLKTKIPENSAGSD
jgi:hypothetical protein